MFVVRRIVLLMHPWRNGMMMNGLDVVVVYSLYCCYHHYCMISHLHMISYLHMISRRPPHNNLQYNPDIVYEQFSNNYLVHYHKLRTNAGHFGVLKNPLATTTPPKSLLCVVCVVRSVHSTL